MRLYNMINIKNWILSLAMVASIGGTLLTFASPQIVAAAPAANCNEGFLGFPAWYRGMVTTDGLCNIKSPSALNTPGVTPEDGLSKFIWTIGLNIVEMALVAVAYISGFYFIYGGFLFIVSQGKPEGAAKARSTLLDSLIGLIISLAAITIVNFIVDGILK